MVVPVAIVGVDMVSAELREFLVHGARASACEWWRERTWWTKRTWCRIAHENRQAHRRTGGVCFVRCECGVVRRCRACFADQPMGVQR